MHATVTSLPAELRQTIIDHCEAQAYRQAMEALEPFQPYHQLEDWRDLILVGRVLDKYGAQRSSRVYFWRGWRRQRQDLRATCYMASFLAERFSAWDAWRLLQTVEDDPQADVADRAYYWGLHTGIHLELRDFERAKQFLERTREIEPNRPYHLVLAASMYERMDRREAALEKCDEALAMQPYYLSAVQAKAHLLNHMERADEAVELLQEARGHIQSFTPSLHLMSVLRDSAQPERALQIDEEIRREYAIVPPDLEKTLQVNRAQTLLELDRFDEAADILENSDLKGVEKFIEKIRRIPPHAKKVQLDIPFVRQNFKTCVPASLSMISNYVGEGFDHLELARDLTYDGTPDSAERTWIEERGWRVRECSLDQKSLKTFIDAGFPAAVTTIGIDFAHMQAVVGYDEREESILIRDPNTRMILRWSAEDMFEDDVQPLRCLLLAPSERAAELDALELTDAALWDKRFRVRRLINDRKLEEAKAALEELQIETPDHHVTLDAAFALAAAKRDYARLLEVLDALLKLFPKDAFAIATKFRVLQGMARQKDARDFLATLSESVFENPRLLEVLLEVLGGEGLDTEKRAVRALRSQPQNPRNYGTLAGVFQVDEEPEKHLFAARAAATLDSYNEGVARMYFYSAWAAREVEPALEWLRSRLERQNEKDDPGPTITYYSSLGFLNRHDEAQTLFEQALERFSDDASFGYFAAEEYAELGELEKAEAILQREDLQVDRGAWAQVQSKVLLIKGDFEEALKLWEALINDDVNTEVAIDMVAKLTYRLKGPEAGVHFLKDALEKRPESLNLMPMLIQWLRAQDEGASRAYLEQYLERNPENVWALREMSIMHSIQKEYEAALKYLRQAEQLAPYDAETHCMIGQVLFESGDVNGAREAYRRTLCLNVADENVVGAFFDVSPKMEDRQALLQLLEEEIVRQPGSGPAVDKWRQLLFQLEKEDAVEASLKQLLERRGDLPQSWANLAIVYLNSGRAQEALDLLEDAKTRFPMELSFYFIGAAAQRNQLKFEEEITLLETAIRLAPNHEPAYEQLSEALCRLQRHDEAIELLQGALRRNPLYAGFQLALADAYTFSGRKKEGLEAQQKALRLEPSNLGPWDVYWQMAKAISREGDVLDFARSLAAQHPGEVVHVFNLARVNLMAGRVSEARKQLRQAVKLAPNSVPCVDLLAETLSNEGKHNDAIQLCREWKGGGFDAIAIRRREAITWGQQGNLKRAEGIFREIRRDNPYDLETIFWLARCHEADQSTLKLQRLAEEIRADSPSWAQAHALAGRIYHTLQNEQRALECHRAAYEIAPDNEEFIQCYFYALLQAKEYATAREVLSRVKLLVAPAPWRCMELEMLAEQHASDAELLECLGELQLAVQGPDDIIRNILEKLMENKGAAYVSKLLTLWVTNGAERREAVDLWITAIQKQDQMRKARRQVGDISNAELRAYAHERMLKHLQQLNQKRSIKRYLERYSDQLRETSKLRAVAIAQLRAVGLQNEAADFMRDSIDRLESPEEWSACLELSLDHRDEALIGRLIGHIPEADATADQVACRVIFDESMPTEVNGHLDGDSALRSCARIVHETHGLSDKKQIKQALKRLRRRKKARRSDADSYVAERASARLTSLTGVKLSWFGF